MDLRNFLSDLLSETENVKNSVEEEREKIDRKEMEKLQGVETEWGDTIAEAISKIQTEVQRKDNKLNNAVQSLNRVEKRIGQLEEGEWPHASDGKYGGNPEPSNLDDIPDNRVFEELEGLESRIDEAAENLREAEQIDEEIEGLISQAEQSFRSLVENLEEVKTAEEKSEEIETEATAHLRNLEQKNEELRERISDVRKG